jgi:hypothetical protein
MGKPEASVIFSIKSSFFTCIRDILPAWEQLQSKKHPEGMIAQFS